jgi:hypothetical protein
MVLAAGLRECLSGRQRALVKPTATPFGASRAHRLGSVLSPCFWLSRLSCKDAVSRFSFAHTCSSSAISIIVRTCVYCPSPTTALLHGSRSLAASLPCRATGWLSVCARACVPSALRLYLTSLPALPASEVLACCLLPAAAAPHTLYLCATPLPAAYPRDHYSTQPAISRTIASAARIPSIHPSSQTLAPSALTHQSLPCLLACLLCLCLAQLPSRGALPTSPLLSRGTRRRATPCAALGNYTRTTCGTCRPRGRSRALDGSGPHNAQGKQSTSRLTSSPTIPTPASTNCQSTHSPTPSLFALPGPKDDQP